MKTENPLRFFSETQTGITELKTNLSDVFNELSNYIVKLSNEMISFRGSIKPYAEYYFIKKEDAARSTFTDDILIPVQQEIISSFNSINTLAIKNKKYRNQINTGINKLMQIQSEAESLLGDMDNFSQMVLSAHKLKISDNSLLSEHLIHNKIELFRKNISSVSKDFRNISRELSLSYNDFLKINDGIESLNEVHISDIEKQINITLDTLSADIEKSAQKLEPPLLHLNTIETSVSGLISNIQLEDIVRQNMEKIIYFLGFIYEINDKYTLLQTEITGAKLTDIISYIFRKKTNDLSENFSFLLNNVQSCANIVRKNIKDFHSVFCDGKHSLNTGTFDTIIGNFTAFETNLVGDLKKILSLIKKLNSLLYIVFGIKKKYNTLLVKIYELSSQLDPIRESGTDNLGEQSNIFSLRAKIMLSVNTISVLFKNINYEMGNSIDEMHRNLMAHEEILQNIIFNLQKITSRIKESHSYYRKITGDIIKNTVNISEFLSEKNRAIEDIKEAGKIIDTIKKKAEKYFSSAGKKQDKDDIFAEEIKIIKEAVEKTGERGDYRNMMLISLFNETGGKKSEENVILF